MSENQSHKRHPLRPEATPLLFLEFDLGGERLSGHVEKLHKSGLVVAVPALNPHTVTRVDVKEAALFEAEGDRVAVQVRLDEVRRGEDGITRLWLEADTNRARGVLWLKTLELRGEGGQHFRHRTVVSRDQLPKIPARGQYTEQARLERLTFARAQSGEPLASLDNVDLEAHRLTGNIEHLMGSVEIPVGVAGPLLFCGERAEGVVFAPMATTEGALVASACRGATAISRSGGVTTRVICQRMMRVPLFVLTDFRGAYLFCNWIRDHVDEIRAQTRKVSRHAELISVVPNPMGHSVHVTFLYETGDAAGQNMTTSCTWQACQWLMKQVEQIEEIRFENMLIDGNMSGDKKVTYRSFLEGRGTRVSAECFIARETLQQVLKVTPEELAQAHHDTLQGSLQAGTVGYNVNVANVIAALFTATGQDIACVHESSLGQLHIRAHDDGIYASMLLPSLIIGTVGGGTALPRQRDFLAMMGCSGPQKAGRFAEIIAGYCLALDLSTLSAVASGQFATAHEKLGRNRPVDFLRYSELTPEFFTAAMHNANANKTVSVTAAVPIKNDAQGSSIITELTAHKVDKLVGHFPFRLRVQGANTSTGVEVLAKIKPLDTEVMLMSNAVAANCGGLLASRYAQFKAHTGFAGCHKRELELYRCNDPRFTRHAPKVYGLVQDDSREIYIALMERLQDMVLMDTADDVSGWSQRHIETALRGIAQFHAIWYGRENELMQQPWLQGAIQTTESMTQMIPLWEALGIHAREEFPEWVSERDLQRHHTLVRAIPQWWRKIEDMPRTLIHNDFNPRNIALRRIEYGRNGNGNGNGNGSRSRSRSGNGSGNGNGKSSELRLCAYDWELATLHLPQHDCAELLIFVLSSEATQEQVDHYLEVHRRALEEAAGVAIDPRQWKAGYNLSLADLLINRMAMYVMAHTFRHYPFMQRCVGTLLRLIDLQNQQNDPQRLFGLHDSHVAV